MPKVEDKTSNLKDKSEKNRDSMAKTTPKRWLAKLLIDKKTMTMLLIFLNNTKVGGKKSIVEKEMKWR